MLCVPATLTASLPLLPGALCAHSVAERPYFAPLHLHPRVRPPLELLRVGDLNSLSLYTRFKSCTNDSGDHLPLTLSIPCPNNTANVHLSIPCFTLPSQPDMRFI